MQKKWLILIGIFLFLIPTVMAVQPEEKYTKIFGNPFYRATMTNNNDYNWTISVNPPDGLSSVLSAIMTFDIYLNPSVNFTIQANGKPCNTYFYYVSTTYAGAGQSRVTFDCSNIISKAGNYNITLRPSGANTGSVSGWLDLTYMNNPKQENLFVSGTEYQTGEAGTIFLQLKDSQGNAVNDGNCYLDVYYPSYGNLSHPVLYTDIGMLYKTGSNGIYFYDMVVPNITGVYMLGASCAYAYQVNWLYDPSETIKKPTRTAINGTYLSDTIVLNSYEDGLYEKCTAILFGGNRVCEAYYDFNSTGISNFTALDLYYAGESDAAPTATFYVWNWTSSAWITLANTLTFSSTASASSPPAPTSIDEFVTNPITPSNYTINYTTKITRIRMRIVLGTTYNLYNNWLALKFLTSEGQIQELKGSGELHVSNALSNLTVSLNASQNITALSTFANGKYVGGTEYISGDRGRTLAQITKMSSGNQEPILTATCSVNITYPNGTAFITNGNAPFLTASNGLYYYNFTVPSTEGVYAVDYKCVDGSKEYYVSGTFHVSNYIAGNMTSILAGQANILGNLSSMTNYLITINSTTYQINQSLYNDYLSLLAAINSVNATANQSLQYIISINGTVYQINNTINSKFQEILSFLASINYTLNTTLEYKLDLINGTVFQINQSQYTNYISLLNAINSVNSTVNTTLLNYLIQINGTTYQINSSQFIYYTNLLQAINSVNQTVNTTILNYLIGINGTTYNISQQIPLILQYLHDINITTNTTIPASLISINNTQNQHFVDIMNFLASINYTGNTTLELKLDQINDTVVQINTTVNNLSVDLTPVLNAIGSVNTTLNTTILNILNQINTTTTQNQQYILLINGTVFQINQSVADLNNSIYNLNQSQYQNYLSLLNLLLQINQTGNTTLSLVASINQTLWNDIFVILKDINFTTNTTLEYKLDLINYTTWQSWMILQNLTIGNVSVTANVNWTEGVPIIWNASGQSQINYSLLSLSQEGIQLVVETLTCLDNTTLIHTMNITNCVFGQCLDSVKNITETCAHGCANNMCVPPQTIQFSLAIAVALMITGLIWFVWRTVKR
jgi:hypothetical protein